MPPGLEEPCAREVRSLGAAGATVLRGGVACTGDLATVVRLDLGLRTASRVLVRVSAGPADRAAAVARAAGWSSFVAPGETFEVDVSGAGRHDRALARTIASAICARGAREARGGDQLVLGRVEAGELTLSVDASGEHLHRRGYREETGAAPLRENLAAGILLLAGHDGDRPLVDPMCGSGTFLIEGALLALRRPPGAARTFRCEAWPCLPAGTAAAERERLRAGERERPLQPIAGSDLNAGALGVARRNATRAGVLGHLSLQRRDVGEATPPPGAPAGVVVANPPYGKRVGERQELSRLYARLGTTLRERFAGWTAAILVADERLEPTLGLRNARVVPLDNGGIACRLLIAGL